MRLELDEKKEDTEKTESTAGGKTERLEDWADNRKEHMKDMPLKERLKWYVTYYWIRALVIGLVVCLAGYFIWINTLGKKETWLGGAIINLPVDTKAVDEVEEEFGSAQGLTKKQLVTLDLSYTLDAAGSETAQEDTAGDGTVDEAEVQGSIAGGETAQEDTADEETLQDDILSEENMLSQNDIANMTKIQVYYASGDLDLVIAPEAVFDYLEEREYSYRDLGEVLGEEFIAGLDQEQLRYSEDADGNEVVTGISLEETDFLKKICPEAAEAEKADGEKIYAGVFYSASNADHAAAFLQYVLEQ